MPLKLTRPLVCFDVETTGTDPKTDRIVQLGLVKTYPDGRVTEWETLVNPRIAIPPEVTAVHGITDEMVRDAPPFPRVAPMIVAGFRDCDIAGYNVTFDLRFLKEELLRCGAPLDAGLLDGYVVDGYRIFKEKEPHDLTTAVAKYLGTDHQGAHTALADARATLGVIEAQIAHYGLPETPQELHAAFFDKVKPGHLDPEGKIAWRNGEACLNFGKYPGMALRKVDHGYLRWIMAGDFSPKVKAIVGDALRGVYPERPEGTTP